MNKYTKAQINTMLKEGELTSAQAREMLDDLAPVADTKEEIEEIEDITANVPDPLLVLADELKSLTAQVESAISGQGDAIAAIQRFLPIMVNTYTAIKNIKLEIPKPEKRITEWEINAKRDKQGIIIFPYKIRAIK